MLGEPSRQCPICRKKFAYVKYAFAPDGRFNIHLPGKGDQDSDPFLRDDEIVSPGTSEAEKRRKIELRRLRTLEDIDLQSFIFDNMTGVAAEGDTVITVNRDMILF